MKPQKEFIANPRPYNSWGNGSARVSHNHPEGIKGAQATATAVSLGGDSDTLTAIACSMAEAFYGIPEDIAKETVNRLPEDMLEVLVKFQKFMETKNSVKESAK